jgi:hypothetical protein
MALSAKPTKLYFAASPESMPEGDLVFGDFVISELSVEEVKRCGFSLCLSGLRAIQGRAAEDHPR